MITFDYPAGLLLLLVIPLLLFFVRSRSIPRLRVLTALFLLDEMKAPEPAKTFRFFLLKKRHRQSLVALMVAGLAFAISGTSLEIERDIPEKWLVVVDNLPLGMRIFEGRSIHDSIRSFLRGEAARFGEEDSVTVMTTSPSPVVRTFTPGKDLREYLDGITIRAFMPDEFYNRARFTSRTDFEWMKKHENRSASGSARRDSFS